MHINYTIGNPPYSDRTNASGSGDGGIGPDLDSEFVRESFRVSDTTSLIIRAKHFCREESQFRRELFTSGKVVSIRYLPKSTFPTITNTWTCIITLDKKHQGACSVTYLDGTVVNKQLDGDTILKWDNPDYVIDVPDSMGHRFIQGGATRGHLVEVEGGHPVVEIMGRGEKPVIKYVGRDQAGMGVGIHGVVMNKNAGWTDIGRLWPKPLEYGICLSTAMLRTSSYEESLELIKYLESPEIKDIISRSKRSFNNSKYLFRMIPDLKL